MLISVRELSRYWGLRPQRILHIGAHAAEEAAAYTAEGWGADITVWVEADPKSAAHLRRALKLTSRCLLVEALAWDRSGERLKFNVTSNGESSSALPLLEHRVAYPEVVVTEEIELTSSALYDIPTVREAAPFDFINLDIQGAELRALVGLGSILDSALAVYTEVNIRPLYEGCALLAEMDDFLSSRGFERVDSQMVRQGWGDALWLKRGHIPSGRVLRAKSRLVLWQFARVGRRIKRGVRAEL